MRISSVPHMLTNVSTRNHYLLDLLKTEDK